MAMSAALPPELSELLDAPDVRARNAAWHDFTQTYSKLLLHTAHSLGGGYDAAMDRYSYVLEQLQRDDFRRLRGYAADGRSKFSTWLVVVARRLCLDYTRQRYGRVRGGTAADDLHERRRRLANLVGEQIDLTRLQDAAAPDPERVLSAREIHDVLASALERLEPRDRLLIRLRFEDELSAQEIASMLKLPSPFHVYRRLSHLFSVLRRTLLREGVQDPVP
jgi:RNA polymerase sigma factor (sigma-70 family)